MNSPVIREIRKELKKKCSEQLRKSGERFFREKVKMYGYRTADVSRLGRDFFRRIRDKSKEEIYGLCEELWQSGYMEESFIACQWSRSMRKKFMPEDFLIFEKWIGLYINNWASCDTFCNHTVGDFITMFPEYAENLKKWAGSDNRWMRRAAAVSFIVPAKKGKFMDEVFAIADLLLTDEDDLVRKGYGWMLKAASQADTKRVFDYVMKNKTSMPRTSLRYAIEKMPVELRAIAMDKQVK